MDGDQDEKMHRFDHTHGKSTGFQLHQACSWTHHRHRSHRYPLDVLSVFASALAEEVAGDAVLGRTKVVFAEQKGLLPGLLSIV